MEKVVRKRITFYGQVQGVGFRYRAIRGAEYFSCTGWVRNEYDGTVKMEIQGTKNDIDDVINAIGQGRYVDIRDMKILDVDTVDGERGFKAL